MASRTLTLLRDALRIRIGNPNVGDVPNTTLTDVLNAAINQIADRYPFRVMKPTTTFVTVNGTQSYNLGTGVNVVLGVWDTTNNRRLFRRGDRVYDLDTTPTVGIPLEYSRNLATILLWPTPDAVYTIQYRYKRTLTALSADSDTHIFGEAWEGGFLKLARYMYYDEIAHDASKAASAMSSWSLWISSKPSEIDEEAFELNEAVDVTTITNGNGRRYDFDEED